MNARQAAEIVELARGGFNKKTFNKLYSKKHENAPPMLTANGINAENDSLALKQFRSEADPLATKEQRIHLKKAVDRYNTRAASAADKLRNKNSEERTAYIRGRDHLKRFNANEDMAGNCSEQSDLAAYLAVIMDGSVRNLTYICEIEDPGDHVFCAIMLRSDPPSWRNVAEMVEGCVDSRAFILDPWMNFSCYAGSYRKMASDKANKWLSAGKRISWWGKNNNMPGWYQPGGDYLECFLQSTLKFEKAV